MAGLSQQASADRLRRRRGLDRLRHDQRALVHRPRPGGRGHRLPHRDRQVGRRHRRRSSPAAGWSRCGSSARSSTPTTALADDRPPGRRWPAPTRGRRRASTTSALRPGTSADAYAQALQQRLGPRYRCMPTRPRLGPAAHPRPDRHPDAAAGHRGRARRAQHRGAETRERVHDLGVFKAIGMTPRQTIAMVVCWVAGTGLVAGLIAVPAGVALHRYVLPAMAAAANRPPRQFLNVYAAGESPRWPWPAWRSRWPARCSRRAGPPPPGPPPPCAPSSPAARFHDREQFAVLSAQNCSRSRSVL